MRDRLRSKKGLISELEQLRARLAELQESDAGDKPEMWGHDSPGSTQEESSPASGLPDAAAGETTPSEVSSSGLDMSEEKYRSLTQTATDAIISAGADGRIISWNRGAERIFGYRESEAIGKPLTMLMPEDLQDQHQRSLARFLESPDSTIIGGTMELVGLSEDGRTFPVELSLSSWTAGGDLFFTGIIRDISRRKKIEESELQSRLQMQSYAHRLSVLHEIGLSLNRETDQPRLLRSVLRAAAELTSAGLGVMTLTKDGRTEIISVFYAPWFTGRCEIGDEIPTLHQRIAGLVREGSDATRINDTSRLMGLPEGHLRLKGLLIATLRDTQGRTRGHFMLSNKADGAEFTKEDEQVIALLAAQSSVALLSAETFEREHTVAKTLQEALLPDILLRDDIEIGLLYKSSSPVGKVGGDFYDFVELDGNRVAVFVGDVCGKGLSAATYTAMIKYMLWAYLDEGFSPAECLTRVNAAVNKHVPVEKFVTLGLSVIDTDREMLTHASAGHPPPVLCRSHQPAPLEIEQAVPLGVIRDQRYHEMDIPLDGACSLTMFTDGLLDARPEGSEPFGETRLLKALSSRCCNPAQEVARDLVNAVMSYSQDQLKDDIALVVVRLLKATSEIN